MGNQLEKFDMCRDAQMTTDDDEVIILEGHVRNSQTRAI